MDNKVQEIHNSNLYGIFIETGCGAALANKLYAEPGSSKTVYYSMQPYSKEYEHQRYGDFNRSVSNLFVRNVVLSERKSVATKKVNLIYASSWQLTDGESMTHGWIGFMCSDDVIMTMHFSFLKGCSLTRNDYINHIADIGVSMLSAMNFTPDANSFKFDEKLFIEEFKGLEDWMILDQAYLYDTKTHNQAVNYSLLLNVLENNNRDYPLVFGLEETVRFEELMRRGNEFVVQKGSFNPLHHQHVQMMKSSKELYPNVVETFLISTYRYDKPHIDIDDLIERIENITRHGYNLIICREIYFYGTFRLLMNWAGREKKFYFPMGSDTINRIYKTDEDGETAKHGNVVSPFATKTYIDGMVRIFSKQFQLLVHKRNGYEYHPNVVWYGDLIRYVDNYEDDGTSSTKIRNGEIKNMIDEQNS